MEWTRPDKFSKFDVDVGLPRFKLEEKYDMKDLLVSLGMVDAFDVSMCDFSGTWTTSEVHYNLKIRKQM